MAGSLTILAFLIAWSCSVAAIWSTGSARARRLVPVSGALLAGTAVFGLVPELAREIGWPVTLGLVAAAYAGLTILDKQGYPVCPSCSHGEGFAFALIVATGLHAFVDGWGMAAVGAGGRVVEGGLGVVGRRRRRHEGEVCARGAFTPDIYTCSDLHLICA